jgi:hypothetical protein
MTAFSLRFTALAMVCLLSFEGRADSPSVTAEVTADISKIAQSSSCSTYKWKNRGKAPSGYIKGMALVYAKSLCRLRAGQNAAIVTAQKNRNKATYDALTHYESRFDARGMEIDTSGADTLRSVFTLGIGLGMRESSGQYCEGRDLSATNTKADTAEAGLFQTSWNARGANAELTKLFNLYRAGGQKCYLDTFKVGISCSSGDLSNFGSGDGLQFQKLAKSCPAFAAEFAMITLRTLRRHYGPLREDTAEVQSSCYSMLDQVKDYVEAKPAKVCGELL